MNAYKAIDDLVIRFKGGDKAAGELLVMTFKPLVLSTMAKLHVAPEDQEDAFQDGICAFLEGLKKFDIHHGAGFNAFIKTHLKQFYLKRQSGRFNHSIHTEASLSQPIQGEEGLTLADVLVDETVNIEGAHIDNAVRKDRLQQIKKGWQTLSDGEKQVIHAHYIKGHSLRKIAKEKGLVFSTVQSYCNRAIKKIKKLS